MEADVDERKEHESEEQCRDETEDASDVERLHVDVAVRIALTQEQCGDEEPAHDEEQLGAEIAGARRREDTERVGARHRAEVEPDHEHDGDRPAARA